MDDRFLGGDGRPDLEFAVAGGTLTDVKREDGAGNTRSVINVRPDAEGDITIVLTGRATCDRTHLHVSRRKDAKSERNDMSRRVNRYPVMGIR
jgi:hypothetical protein